jgi:hypothetical protein
VFGHEKSPHGVEIDFKQPARFMVQKKVKPRNQKSNGSEEGPRSYLWKRQFGVVYSLSQIHQLVFDKGIAPLGFLVISSPRMVLLGMVFN